MSHSIIPLTILILPYIIYFISLCFKKRKRANNKSQIYIDMSSIDHLNRLRRRHNRSSDTLPTTTSTTTSKPSAATSTTPSKSTPKSKLSAVPELTLEESSVTSVKSIPSLHRKKSNQNRKVGMVLQIVDGKVVPPNADDAFDLSALSFRTATEESQQLQLLIDKIEQKHRHQSMEIVKKKSSLPTDRTQQTSNSITMSSSFKNDKETKNFILSKKKTKLIGPSIVAQEIDLF